jgi:hypothetical protein
MMSLRRCSWSFTARFFPLLTGFFRFAKTAVFRLFVCRERPRPGAAVRLAALALERAEIRCRQNDKDRVAGAPYTGPGGGQRAGTRVLFARANRRPRPGAAVRRFDRAADRAAGHERLASKWRWRHGSPPPRRSAAQRARRSSGSTAGQFMRGRVQQLGAFCRRRMDAQIR